MAPVVGEQAARTRVPEANYAIQAASVYHSRACLPQQLHNARLQAQKGGAVRGGARPRSLGEGEARQERATRPYLMLTLVPKCLRRQVIDGQGSVQVADSSQRHPGQRGAAHRLKKGWGTGAHPISRAHRPRLDHSHTAEAQGFHRVGLALLTLPQVGLGGHSLGSEDAHDLSGQRAQRRGRGREGSGRRRLE